MRVVLVMLLGLACWCLLGNSAQAISVKNEARLMEHFTGLGQVHYSLFAPLGGPEVGGAVIDDGDGTGRLVIARVEKDAILELLTEGLSELSDKPPFTFLFTGHHALVYPTRSWTDTRGVKHRRGDLVIYDITMQDTPLELFALKDVCDIMFQAGGALSADNLLRQPSSHFLNSSSMLPVKYNYCQLSFEPAPAKADSERPSTDAPQVDSSGEAETGDDGNEGAQQPEQAASASHSEAPEYTYVLSLPLKPMANAASVDAANLNNRAIFNYYRGRLLEATRLLTQADNIAESNQNVILRNQSLINSELDDLGAQARLMPGVPFDEALQYYWQGDYLGLLRIMDIRRNLGMSDNDYALLGLALAHEKRWPEVDRVTVELERRGWPLLADFLWELNKIAEVQGFTEIDGIANQRLLALEAIDTNHPGYIAGLARLLRRTGQEQQAVHVLGNYVFNPVNADIDLSEPRWELYQMRYHKADQIGCDQLIESARAGPILNLLGYVQLVDFIDYSTALTDVPIDHSGRMKVPEYPLETFGVN